MIKLHTVEELTHLAAPPEEVFPYFTDAVCYVKWMGRKAQLEPYPGGLYRVWMGDGFGAVGTYLEVDPSNRLVFTWGFAQGAGQAVLSGAQADDALPPGSTRVEVSFAEEVGGTLLTLRHLDLPTLELRDSHNVAWKTYLGRLRTGIDGRDPGPEPHSDPA